MWLKLMIAGVLIRIAIIQYISHGYNFYEGELGITDIDYKVYVDASAYQSPYERHTYRYSPILSYLVSPSAYLHQNFGKYVFVLFDVVAMWFLYHMFDQRSPENRNQKISILQIVTYSFNPILIYITVRGSCQSITIALYFAFLYFFFGDSVHGNMSAYERRDKGLVQRQPNKIKRYLSYALFGVAVHFRVFPIILVPLLIMYEYHSVKKDNFKQALKFALDFGLVAGGVFIILAAYFYYLYGYDFLHQTYFYHFTRRDNRHSCSAFFYEIYLNYESDSFNGQFSRSIPRVLPRLVAIFASSFVFVKRYSFFYCQAIILVLFVILNKIINGQYYMWLFCSFCLIHSEIEGLREKLLSRRLFTNIILPHLCASLPTFLWQINADKLGVSDVTLYDLWYNSIILVSCQIFGYSLYIKGIKPYQEQSSQSSIQYQKKQSAAKKNQ